MKKLCLTIVFFATSLTMWAQTTTQQQNISPEERAQKATERLTKALSLDERQAEKIYQIHLKYAQARTEQKAIKEQSPKIHHHKTMREEIKQVLTPEQQQKARSLHQKHRKLQHDLKQNETLRKELKQYHQQNIMPIMKTQRLKLEAELSENEKQTITQVRAEMKQILKHKKIDKRQEGLSIEERKKQHQEAREKMRKTLQPLKAIAEKHRETLKTLHQEITPQEKEWRENRKQIIQKYLPEGEKMPPPPPALRAPHHKIVKFLLLDPYKSQSQVKEEGNLEIFPNPSRDIVTVRFEVNKSSKVRINLLDQQGNLVRQLLDEQKSAGSHKIQLNTNDLVEGVYYCLIETNGTTEKQRILVQK